MEGRIVKTDLNVAIFAWIPNAAASLESLEEAFEDYTEGKIDLNLELWDPYETAVSDDGLLQIHDFDLVEIDLVRLDDLLNDPRFGGLDPLPTNLIQDSDKLVGAARALRTHHQEYFVPHWICGNYLVHSSKLKTISRAESFDDLLCAIDSIDGAVLADLAGSATLGEFYADAVLDQLGAEEARKHLISLATKQELYPFARKNLVALATRMKEHHRRYREHYHDYKPHIYAEDIADGGNEVLIGYSERMYYVDRWRVEDPLQDKVKANEFVVRQFPFAESSQGTPSWVDGFVIPKGRIASNGSAITEFLQFISSTKGYETFVNADWKAPAYLLPASVAGYSETLLKSQPLLPQFQREASSALVMDEPLLYQAVRVAGKLLNDEIN